MGASKRICEMLTYLKEFQSDKTSILTTRFGNVLGSNGSVVNIFKDQISKGGPCRSHPQRYYKVFHDNS